MEPKKAFKSFRYKTTVVWKSARRGVISSLGKPEMEVGNPPEFKGEPGIWTPEDMLVGAVNTCLMLTFLSFAYNKNLVLVAYQSSAEGLLENAEGKYRVTEITVEPTVTVKSDADLGLAREIMEKVKPNCFISNSVTANVILSPRFRVGSTGG